MFLHWDDPEGWDGRWEVGSGWGTHVHLWQIHVNVWQNLQYCNQPPVKINKLIFFKKRNMKESSSKSKGTLINFIKT